MRALLMRGDEIKQMMTVVGEEGTNTDDFTIMLKAEFFDNCFLQQNAFDKVDAATPADRQQFVFGKIAEVADLDFDFTDKTEARHIMVRISDLFRNWNYAEFNGDEYKKILSDIDAAIAAKGRNFEAEAEVEAEVEAEAEAEAEVAVAADE